VTRLWPLLALGACDPWAAWPDPTTVYPYVYTPEEGLPDYAHVRVETETFTPLVDPEPTALYLEKSFAHRPGAPVESLLHFGQQRQLPVPPKPDDVLLDLAGDVLPVDGVDLSAIEPLLTGDLALANLETPTAPGVDTVDSLYAFNADPSLVDALPFDVLQLNNNHSLDAGDEGLRATVAAVRARDRVALGVSDHALVRVKGTTIALLSYTWGLNVDAPTAHDLFVVPFGHLQPIDLSRIRDDVLNARARGAELVVVLAHWGYEYEYYPDPLQMQRAREIVAAGADLVVGHGPHVAQPVEICSVDQPSQFPGVGTCSVRSPDERPRVAAIFYSLGNLTSTMLTVPTQVGLLAQVSLRPDRGVTGLDWVPVAQLDADGGGPRVVPLDEAVDDPALLEESLRLDAHVGGRWRRR
jgi:poly-gamma-glutamate synthesis protein (capsule biosynthesis protein)